MAHHSLSALGEQVACSLALSRRLTAAGTGDNSEVDGEDIDRFVNGTNASGGIFGSVVFAVTARATLTEAKTLVVKATLQDSADGSTWADVAAALQPSGAADSTIRTLTGGVGGTTETSINEIALDCASLRRYVRIQLHCDLSHSGTDVADVHCVAVKGGASALPV
jgi:hypothetical protein